MRFATSLCAFVRRCAYQGSTKPFEPFVRGHAAPVVSCGHPWEHAFVTSQGSPYMRFRRALDSRNVTDALSAASALEHVGLAEALELTLLLAKGTPEKYERAALRWHTRFVRETRASLVEAQAVLALLAVIPTNPLAAPALADLLSGRRGLERAAEALVGWSRS
jgi:hypothetical protein